MIRLSNVNKLTIGTSIAGSSTTVFFSDKAGTNYDGGSQVTSHANATPQDVCNAPVNGTIRDIDNLIHYNGGNADADVVINMTISNSLISLLHITVPQGKSLQYTHASGWGIIGSSVAGATLQNQTLAGRTGPGDGSSQNITLGALLQLSGSNISLNLANSSLAIRLVNGSYANATLGGNLVLTGSVLDGTNNGSIGVTTHSLVGRYSSGTGIQQNIALGDMLDLSSNGTLTITIANGTLIGRLSDGTYSNLSLPLNSGLQLVGSTLQLKLLANGGLALANGGLYATFNGGLGGNGTNYTGAGGIQVTGSVISPLYGRANDTMCQGNDTRLGTAFTSTKTTTYTAVIGDNVLVDPQTASGNFTVTLPTQANCTVGLSVGITCISSNLTKKIAIGNNGQNVNGDTNTAIYDHCLVGDSVNFLFSGNATGWVTTEDKIRAHTGKLQANVSQNLLSNTVTKLSFNAMVFDTGNITDLSNSRFVVRRAGYYQIIMQFYSGGPGFIYYTKNSVQIGSAGSSTGSHCVTAIDFLNVGDIIEAYAGNFSGSTLTTLTSPDVLSRMSIRELR